MGTPHLYHLDVPGPVYRGQIEADVHLSVRSGGGTLILVFMKFMLKRTENLMCNSWSSGAIGASQAHWSPQGAKLRSEVMNGIAEKLRGAPESPPSFSRPHGPLTTGLLPRDAALPGRDVSQTSPWYAAS